MCSDPNLSPNFTPLSMATLCIYTRLYSSRLFSTEIIIAGAGVSGLAFAIALHKQWTTGNPTAPPPNITILERDTCCSPPNRHGYSLSLRSDAPSHGIQALQKLGVLDAFIEASIPTGKGRFCVWDATRGFEAPLVKVGGGVPEGLPVAGLRIQRRKIREVLVSAVERTRIKIEWGNAVEDVRVRGDVGKVDVFTKSGETRTCDLLIAADGAGSRVRSILRPMDKLRSLDIRIFGGTARWDGAPPAPVNVNWGIVANGQGESLFVSPMDETSALWAFSFRAEQKSEDKSAEEIMQQVRALQHKFPPLFEEMLDRTEMSNVMAFDARDKDPFRHEASDGPVIYLGDANHAVSPFAGNGANLALSDAWDLVESLLGASSLTEAVSKYDAIMVPRAASVIKQSHFTIWVAHSTGWAWWGWKMVVGGIGWLVSFMSKE